MLTQDQTDKYNRAGQLVEMAQGNSSDALADWLHLTALSRLSGDECVALGDRIARDGHMKCREEGQ